MEQEQLMAAHVANLTRQVEWVKQADAKANFAFAFNMAMLGMLAAVAPKTLSGWSPAPGLFSVLATLLFAYSLVCIGIALFPRTWGPDSSLVYFGGISKHTIDDFREAACALTEDAYLQDLCDQCYRNAEIATTKFKWVQRAIFTLYIAALPWLLAIWLLYSGPARG